MAVTTAITKDPGRQYKLTAEITITAANLDSVVGTAAPVPVIDIPAGATVTGGEFIVDTAWVNASGTTLLDIGDGADDDRYTASQINLEATGRTALTLTGYKYTAADTIDAIIVIATAASDGTTGSARLIVDYYVENRANEAQPD